MFGADQCGFTVLLDRTLHPHLVCLQPGVKVCTVHVYRTVYGREGGREGGRLEGGRGGSGTIVGFLCGGRARGEGNASVEDLFRGLVRRVERTSESYIDEPTKATYLFTNVPS